MNVELLEYKGWRGHSYRLKFGPEVNMMVGLNGCGKTNTLELISILAGHDDAFDYLVRGGECLEHAAIRLRHEDKTFEFVIEGELDRTKITEFKSSLPTKCSFVLQTNLRDDELVTERRDPVECQGELIEFLNVYDMPMNIAVTRERGASCLVSETGAQHYLLHVGMRRAPHWVPMLVDTPERHLHPIIRRSIMRDFYCDITGRNQVIGATHCPEIIAQYFGRDDMAPRRRPQPDEHFHVISMDEDQWQW
jgi:predicted ATP-dependent endonuclease of OLD family